jgi:hypothetical protein
MIYTMIRGPGALDWHDRQKWDTAFSREWARNGQRDDLAADAAWRVLGKRPDGRGGFVTICASEEHPRRGRSTPDSQATLCQPSTAEP